MATQVQFRGGTTTEHASFNGAAREVTVDTTKQTLVVQDGSTNGGFPLLREKNPDNQKAFFGTDNDLEVFHTGTDATIDNNTGDLYILTTGSGDDIIIEAMDDVLIKCQGGEDGIKVIGDGAVELYHNGGTAKLATSATGVTVTGVINGTGNLDLITANSQRIRLGTSNELQMYYDGTNSWFIDSSSGGTINTSGKFVFQAQDDAATMAIFHENGACRFWHNTSERLQTTANGIQVGTGTQSVTGGFGQTAWHLDVNNSAGDCYGLFAGLSGAAIELKDTGSNESVVLAANGSANLYSYTAGKEMAFHVTETVSGTTSTTKRLVLEADSGHGRAVFYNPNDMSNPDIGGSWPGVVINKNTCGQIYAATGAGGSAASNDTTSTVLNLSRRDESGDGPQLALDRKGWIKASIGGLSGSNTATGGGGSFAVWTHNYASGANVRTQALEINNNGVWYINSADKASGGRIWAASSAMYVQDGQGRSSVKVSDPGAGNSYTWELTSGGDWKAPQGRGIDFSNNDGPTQGTGGSEVLTDYEIGTWTPTLQYYNTSTSAWTNCTFNNTPDYTTFNYVKVGQIVHVWGYSGGFNMADGAGENARIIGFPYQMIQGVPYYSAGATFTHTSAFGDGTNVKYVATGYMGYNVYGVYPTLPESDSGAKWVSGNKTFMMHATYMAARSY